MQLASNTYIRYVGQLTVFTQVSDARVPNHTAQVLQDIQNVDCKPFHSEYQD